MERKFFNSASAVGVRSTTQEQQESGSLSLKERWQKVLNYLELSSFDVVMISLGNMIMAFSLVNIHIQASITEGGGIGLAILMNKIFGINPAITSFIFDGAMYALGFFLLERGFIKKAVVSTVIFSGFYSIFFGMGPVLPSLADNPILAATLGGIMIGIGCGMVVTRGGVAGGDDCYALIVSGRTRVSLSKAYFISDALVLAASALIYLPLGNVFVSLYSTVISSFIIGQFELHLPELDILWQEGKAEAR